MPAHQNILLSWLIRTSYYPGSSEHPIIPAHQNILLSRLIRTSYYPGSSEHPIIPAHQNILLSRLIRTSYYPSSSEHPIIPAHQNIPLSRLIRTSYYPGSSDHPIIPAHQNILLSRLIRTSYYPGSSEHPIIPAHQNILLSWLIRSSYYPGSSEHPIIPAHQNILLSRLIRTSYYPSSSEHPIIPAHQNIVLSRLIRTSYYPSSSEHRIIPAHRCCCEDVGKSRSCLQFAPVHSRTPRLCCNVKHSSDLTPYRTLWFAAEVVIFQLCVSLLWNLNLRIFRARKCICYPFSCDMGLDGTLTECHLNPYGTRMDTICISYVLVQTVLWTNYYEPVVYWFWSIHNFYFWIFFAKWPRRPFWMTENHFRSHFLTFQINTEFFFKCFHKMAAGAHFGWLKITFNRISRHFRSIRKFFSKWPPFCKSDLRQKQ